MPSELQIASPEWGKRGGIIGIARTLAPGGRSSGSVTISGSVSGAGSFDRGNNDGSRRSDTLNNDVENRNDPERRR